MNWLPFETWNWVTPLGVSELRERLKKCVSGEDASRARKTSSFVGSIFESGFELTAVVSGRSSFLPRMTGRWVESPAGTRINVAVVPNLVVRIGIGIVFASLAILVYERQAARVALMTGAVGVLAWLWLQIGHLRTTGSAQRTLRRLLQADPSADGLHDLFADTDQVIPATASWWLPGAAGVVGLTLCWLIAAGRWSISPRPAIDLACVACGTELLVFAWVFGLSRVAPQNQLRWLALLFAMQVGLAMGMVVDGFAGDGRPILAFRWSPPRPLRVPQSEAASAVSSDSEVSLLEVGIGDFAEFRGPHRDGVVASLRLNPDWQDSPPTILWKRPVGEGWSSFAATSRFAVTQEQDGADEVVACYEAATGRRCWEHRDRARFHEVMGGDGPRATPTIHEGRIYALGATGILNCLEGGDGSPVWSINVVAETSAPQSLFGMAGSPLVWKGLVIVAPGAAGNSVVAYDRASGRRVWGAGNAEASYASPQLAAFGKLEQVLCFHAEGLTSHAAADGQILWNVSWETPPDRNNVCQPVCWIDGDGRETVFLSSGYGKGCALFDVERREGTFVVTERWRNTRLQAKFSSVVAHEGHVYGLDGNFLACVDLRTGKRCWKGGRYGFGQLLLIGRHVLVLTEDGEIVLCEASPERHREVARMPVLGGRTWNLPTISGERLLIRNDRTAACLRLPVVPPVVE